MLATVNFLSLSSEALLVILAVLGFFFALTLLTFWRLSAKHTISEREFFAHLLTDICLLTTLFALTGGATNPFVSFYLFPIIVSASTLHRGYTWVLLGIGLALYSSLFLLEPLQNTHDMHSHHGNTAPSFSLHLYGMWINFAFSALLIGSIVVKMRTAMFHQQDKINQQRESTLRDERVIAIATQAANITHSLGTPLSTMDIIINDLRHDTTLADIKDDMNTLAKQLDYCKGELQRLRQSSSKEWQNHDKEIDVSELMSDLSSEMQLLYGASPLDIQIMDNAQHKSIAVDFNLRLALINLLDNACTASPERVDIRVSCDNRSLSMTIRDYGKGIPEALEGSPTEPTQSSKKNGLGLGLFLSHATLERRGGRLSLSNSKIGQGTVSQIIIPLTGPVHDPSNQNSDY